MSWFGGGSPVSWLAGRASYSDKCFGLGGGKAAEALLAPSLPRWLQGQALLSPLVPTSVPADPAGCLIPKGSPTPPMLLDQDPHCSSSICTYMYVF